MSFTIRTEASKNTQYFYDFLCKTMVCTLLRLITDTISYFISHMVFSRMPVVNYSTSRQLLFSFIFCTYEKIALRNILVDIYSRIEAYFL